MILQRAGLTGKIEAKMKTASAVAAPVVRLSEILLLTLMWNAGYKGVRVLNTLFAADLGATPFQIGLLLSAYGLLPLVLAIYAGRMADSVGLRIPVMVGMVLTVIGIMVPYFWHTVPGLFICAVITGTGFIFVQVGLQTLLGWLGTGEARTRNVNLYSLFISTADFIGPVVAGVAIDHIGFVDSYPVMVVFDVVALIGLWFVSKRFPRPAKKSAEQAESQRMSDLVKRRDLVRVFIASCVVMTGLDLFQLYMPLWGHHLGLSATAIGLVMGAYAAAGFTTRVLMPTMVRRFGTERTLFISLIIAAMTFLMIPMVGHPVLLGMISFGLGLGLGLGQPLTVLLTHNYAPKGRAGEAIGLRLALNNSMHVVMPSAFGAIGSLVGLASVFWVSGAFLVYGTWLSRERKT